MKLLSFAWPLLVEQRPLNAVPEAAMASCGVDVNATATVAEGAGAATGALASGCSCALRLEQMSCLISTPSERQPRRACRRLCVNRP